MTLSFIPQSREIIQSLINSQSRQILAKAETILPGTGSQVAVVKVKTNDTLAIEVFESRPEFQTFVFVKRLILPEIRDAYFQFQNQITNLAVSDLDHDGNLEIIVPTFDENLVPRLNVIRYETESKLLVKLGPETFNL